MLQGSGTRLLMEFRSRAAGSWYHGALLLVKTSTYGSTSELQGIPSAGRAERREFKHRDKQTDHPANAVKPLS